MRNKLIAGLAGAAFSFAASGLAFAADMAVKGPPPAPVPIPVFTWTGWYIGATLGYGSVHGESTPNVGDALFPVGFSRSATFNGAFLASRLAPIINSTGSSSALKAIGKGPRLAAQAFRTARSILPCSPMHTAISIRSAPLPVDLE
jgi:hypothetical protein